MKNILLFSLTYIAINYANTLIFREMTQQEKLLYHQIHPLKLCVDISTGFFTTYLCWQHNVGWFLILFLLPSVIATFLIIRFINLQPLKDSRFGRYIQKYMSPIIQLIRFLGQIIMWVAAWYHLPLAIAAGFLIIIAGWLNGLFFKNKLLL